MYRRVLVGSVGFARLLVDRADFDDGAVFVDRRHFPEVPVIERFLELFDELAVVEQPYFGFGGPETVVGEIVHADSVDVARDRLVDVDVLWTAAVGVVAIEPRVVVQRAQVVPGRRAVREITVVEQVTPIGGARVAQV